MQLPKQFSALIYFRSVLFYLLCQRQHNSGAAPLTCLYLPTIELCQENPFPESFPCERRSSILIFLRQGKIHNNRPPPPPTHPTDGRDDLPAATTTLHFSGEEFNLLPGFR